MKSIAATFQDGRVELSQPVNWPDGTPLQVLPLAKPSGELNSPMTHWPAGFFDQLREQWGNEPFERPPQGDSEIREDWSAA